MRSTTQQNSPVSLLMQKGERIPTQPRQRLGPPSSSCPEWRHLGQEGHFFGLTTPCSIRKTPCFAGVNEFDRVSGLC